MASTLWRVVGGADKGGILVRSGLDLKSAQFDQRLSHDAVVEQLSRVGDRIQYKLSSGTGPPEGWVSLRLKDKVLLQEEKSESRYVYIDFPSTHEITATIDELEKLAERRVKAKGHEELKLFDEVLEDLLHMARDRGKRDRIVGFLGDLLKSLYVKAQLKEGRSEASDAICWKLCEVAFASSMQDILLCPARAENSFVVLMCGFGGSHMNDLTPAIEEWSKLHGAAVLAFGPALRERQPMLKAVFERLMSLLEGGKQLVVHMCSDGGFAVFRAVLHMWSEQVGAGSVSIKPDQVLRCIVSDCAGLGQGMKNIICDGTYMEGVLDPTDDQINTGCQQFFAGCGINMFMHAGACKAFYEEPADSFGRALGNAVDTNLFVEKSARLRRESPDVMWNDVRHLLAGVPILILTSKSDRVVIMPRALFFAECVKQIPGRKSILAENWPNASEKILGESGLAVHTHIFPKAPHCRGFISDAAEYWEAVNRLVVPCLAATR